MEAIDRTVREIVYRQMISQLREKTTFRVSTLLDIVGNMPISTLVDVSTNEVVLKVAAADGPIEFRDAISDFPSDHLYARLMLIADKRL